MITSFNRESQKYRAGIMLEGYEKIGCDALNVGYFELLLGKDELQRVWLLRKVLLPMGIVDTMELLLEKLKETKDNEDFLQSMNS